MLTVLGILVGILVVFAITALTGYFVAQEFAFMSVDRSRLAARAERLLRRGVRGVSLVEKPLLGDALSVRLSEVLKASKSLSARP